MKEERKGTEKLFRFVHFFSSHCIYGGGDGFWHSEVVQMPLEEVQKRAQSMIASLRPLDGYKETLAIQIYEQVPRRHLGFIPGSQEKLVWFDSKSCLGPIPVKG